MSEVWPSQVWPGLGSVLRAASGKTSLRAGRLCLPHVFAVGADRSKNPNQKVGEVWDSVAGENLREPRRAASRSLSPSLGGEIHTLIAGRPAAALASNAASNAGAGGRSQCAIQSLTAAHCFSIIAIRRGARLLNTEHQRPAIEPPHPHQCRARGGEPERLRKADHRGSKRWLSGT